MNTCADSVDSVASVMKTTSDATQVSPPAPGRGGYRYPVRHLVLLALVAVSWVALFLVGPIRQPQAYYRFADQRAMLGIPNFCDVTTNLPFLFIGLAGLGWGWSARSRDLESRSCWIAMFAGVASIGLGSAYFHWNPQDGTIFWDRASLAVGFMGFFVAILSEYVSPRLGRWLLGPGLVLAIGSVAYWREVNDLRPYLWVQFTPMLLIPVVLALYRPRFTHSWITVAVLGIYAVAKVAELGDVRLFDWTGGRFSGHSLKHLLGAVACAGLLIQVRIRHRLAEGAVTGSGEASGWWPRFVRVRRSPPIP